MGIAKIHEDDTRIFFNVGGQIEARDKLVLIPERNHVVYSVDDFCQAIKEFGDALATVWIAENKIVGLLDAEPRFERITLPLLPDTNFERLKKCDGETFTQQSLIRLFRYELKGIAGVSELLASVRKIKFRTGQAGVSDIQHGRESMGRELESEVTGAGDIPEDCVVTCRVFRNAREVKEYPIACYLQIFPEKQTFTFRAAAGELDDVCVAALEEVRSRIEGGVPETVKVFFGQP